MRRLLYLYLFAGAALYGCGNYNVVGPTKEGRDYAYSDLEAELKDKEADITLRDGTEVSGAQIHAVGDSIFWINSKSKKASSALARDVKTIWRTNHAIGWWTGLGFGALVSLAVLDGTRHTGFDDPGFTTIIILVPALPLAGGIVGAIIGHPYVYEFAADSVSAAGAGR